MKKIQLRPIESRILAIFLTLVVIIIFYLFMLDKWILTPLNEMDGEIKLLHEARQHYISLNAQGKSIQEQLSILQQTSNKNKNLLSSSDPGAATAELMQISLNKVQNLSSMAIGCTLTNRTPLPIEESLGLIKISINISLECDIESLTKALYNLEVGQPYIFVDAISIRKNTPLFLSNGLNKLEIQLSVTGYLSKHG